MALHPKSVQMGYNMAKLVLMGIGSVHKYHLQSPHMLVQTELNPKLGPSPACKPKLQQVGIYYLVYLLMEVDM